MKPLTHADVLDPAAFQARRRALEGEVIAAKAVRRVTVGDHMTFLFENRLTLWWQVQEMCRVEHIVAPAAIQHELDTYNALGGTRDELSATLLLEYAVPAERAVMLERLLGLDQHVALVLDGHRLPAVFDAGQWNDRRVSSVQFLRFPLGAHRDLLFDLRTPARLVVDHPAYQASVTLPAATRGALCDDLAEGDGGE